MKTRCETCMYWGSEHSGERAWRRNEYPYHRHPGPVWLMLRLRRTRMKRDWHAIAFRICSIVVAVLIVVLAMTLRTEAQDVSVDEIYPMAQSGYYDIGTEDEAQSIALYYICREFDQIRKDMCERSDVLRGDIRELRGWLWGIAGLGTAGGGGGLLVWRKRKAKVNTTSLREAGDHEN